MTQALRVGDDLNIWRNRQQAYHDVKFAGVRAGRSRRSTCHYGNRKWNMGQCVRYPRLTERRGFYS